MGISRERWKQIKSGMAKNGWKRVMELHPDIPQDIKDSLVADSKVNYPEGAYQRQWYYSFNAYSVLFIRPIAQPKAKAEDNKYREPIIERVDSQTMKGIDKYGTVLPQNKAPMPERLEHVAQELTDGLVYIEWIKEGYDKMADLADELTAILAVTATATRGYNPNNKVRQNTERASNLANSLSRGLRSVGKNESK